MHSIGEEVRVEVLARSLAPAITFAVLAVFVFLTPEDSAHHHFFVGIPCALIIATSVWRGLIYAETRKTDSIPAGLWTQFNIASAINSICWGTALASVVFQNETSPLIITFTLLIASSIANASIFTLGNDAKLHVTFVTLTLAPLICICVYRYSTNSGSDIGYLSISLMLFIGLLYILFQGRITRKRFAHLIATQRDLLEQRSMTEHANRLTSLGELAAGFAHEINNPLTVITGNIDLIAKQDLDATLLKYASRAMAASQRISKIVKNLRTLSHRSVEEVREDHEITALIKDTLELYEDRLQNRKITLELQLLEQVVYCDLVQIEQILLNLLNNAIEAVADLPEGERWLKIQISRLDQTLVIAVSNGGPVISSVIADKIFTPFFTTKPVGQGMGLGLAISRTIALNHHGDLRLETKDGHTCFCLVLPLVL